MWIGVTTRNTGQSASTYTGNDLLYALLVALHLHKRLDLAHGQVLAVALRHQLVERAQQLKGIARDLALVERLAQPCHHLREEVQRVDVLQNVGLEVRDKNHVQLIEGLVDEADVVLLDGGVLRAAVGKLGEGGEEGFDAGPGHLPKEAREHGFAASGADGRGEDNLSRETEAPLISQKLHMSQQLLKGGPKARRWSGRPFALLCELGGIFRTILKLIFVLWRTSCRCFREMGSWLG